MAKQTRKKTTAKKQQPKAVVFSKDEKVLVKILNPVFGKYSIVAEVGHVKRLHPNQAKEVVDNGDGEYIT